MTNSSASGALRGSVWSYTDRDLGPLSLHGSAHLLDRPSMIVEQEIIEQICEDDGGWALGRVRDLVRGLGRANDLAVLEGMWHGGHIAFFDGDGARCPDWQVKALFRSRGESPAWFVRATETGLRWVYPE